MSTSYGAYTWPLQPVASPVLRPRALFASPSTVIGLRAASVTLSGATRTLSVWLYGDPPAGLGDQGLWSLQGSPRAVIAAAGTLVAAGVDPDGNPVPAHLDLPVTTASGALPGRAPYRLGVDPAGVALLGLGLDPLRSFLPVRLRPECGEAPDCLDVPGPPARLTPPDYDTLARDYTGLRAMLMERLAALDPGADTSPAELTVTLIELMAHLGDLLHYRLDRAGTEAWLTTARRRAVITRHARLVDFPVPPAISAACWVQVQVAHPGTGAVDAVFAVLPGDTATEAPSDPADSPQAACFTVETAAATTVRASHAEIALYDWTEANATLSVGATSAVLIRPPAADTVADWLPVGALLAFEVVGPGPAGAHQAWTQRLAPWPPATAPEQIRPPLPSHPAQVVRISHAAEITDPLSPGLPLIRVFWETTDALTRPVPVSIDTSGGSPRVGVARLGVFPAHHGLCVDGPQALVPYEPLTGEIPDPALSPVTDYWLTAAAPAGLSCAPGGRPWQLDTTVTLPSATRVAATRVTSLLRATPSGFSVVVDHDDHDPPRLRFATGALGTPPPAQSTVTVRYQVGAGPTGLIAANTLTRLIRLTTPPGQPCIWTDPDPTVTARNLTPGVGGAPPMPLDTVRRDAPQAYTAAHRRAVLIADLPPFAVAVPGVARAAARRSWSGSWPVGVVSVESATDTDDPGLDALVGQALDSVRMAGTEVVTRPATPIGLLIALTVCLIPGTDPALARLSILAVLRPCHPGAVFAPASHPLGTSLYTSTVVAAVSAIAGVDAVRVTEARRLSEPAGTLHTVLAMGPAEIAVCDDDVAQPDRGRIELRLEGGR